MNKSYFILADKPNIKFSKFHMCTWEVGPDLSFVEFGCEIDHASVSGQQSVKLGLHIPWLSGDCKTRDLYERLKDSVHSKFIFNESIDNTRSLDGGDNKSGVIHTFSNGRELGVLPGEMYRHKEFLEIRIDLKSYPKFDGQLKNLYFRILVETHPKNINEKKKGIAKSTIIYDSKINEARSLPESIKKTGLYICKIDACYCFNIIPDRYVTVLEDRSLKSIRKLELESFKKYLNDNRLDRGELLVVFQKKEASESYSFLSIYNDEEIGAAQIVTAILVNLLSGILLFLPGFRQGLTDETTFVGGLEKAPVELYLATIILIATFFYLLRSKTIFYFKTMCSKFLILFKWNKNET